MEPKRKINKIIIHCSDSEFGDAETIDIWHKEKGWDGIGYHFVILNGQINPTIYMTEKDGEIEQGRDIEKIGAHCKGQNKDSIGICLIGRKTFTDLQIISLIDKVKELMKEYGLEINNIYGHYEFDSRKTCPNFNMDNFRDKLSTTTS